MSGFGGFGSGQQQPAPTFGSSSFAGGGAPSSSHQTFSLGGGGINHGFGSSASSTNMPFLSSGAGSTNTAGFRSAGFGQPASSSITGGFAISPNVVAPGGGGGSHQQLSSPLPVVVGNNNFGGSTFSGSTFGFNSTSAPFGISSSTAAPSTSSTSVFGGGFGNPTNTNSTTPFGGGGASSTTTSFGGGFGSNTSSGFTTSGTNSLTVAPTQQVSSFGISSNPFTNAPAPLSSLSFGISSNLATSNDIMPTPRGFGNDDFDMTLTANHSPTPSGMSPMLGSPQYGEEEMADETSVPASSTLPFGTPAVFSASTGTSSWPSASFSRPGSTSYGNLSPIPESGMDQSTSRNVFTRATTESDPLTEIGPPSPDQTQELARLKAKIEEKKRRLEERRRKENVVASKPSSSSPVPMNANMAASTLSMSERNATRFGHGTINDSTRSQLPSNLKDRAEEGTSSEMIRIDAANRDRAALADAKSLLGTCPYMCPDEELLRREREGDIQLLEQLQPGILHPDHWTLRDTVVKRFRRSAADYKLDVPEWVRPPDVLEAVCSYLEEWVMERDRQGPDPRFPNGGIPPSLDVYQFIWDRTRMVRKDFILQNYVGTGGKCDARAVRCHERICRWHAMCEHQLSHIFDFVTMQSQQNIQELGQTMKTLNMYYDDSLDRSIVEVPDEQGRETMGDLSACRYGCSSDIVQGRSPLDYDGSPLSNNASSPRTSYRIIGKQSVTSPAHGTAEPEMRGLYILLTIDNDGGMEVLNYATKLYRERPHIYGSTPVQLALSVYKAKKEYNYVRFFSILRSPSTPYLFGCIMFKYVETMRKIAFRIMSKTYGGRSKEQNEPIFDAYPLRSLARLLCFEDLDEARNACRHFNITVKPREVKSSSGVRVEEFVHWRYSSYSEPKDPDKGTVVPLKPRKMIQTIEVKLQGATRLAVCRGEVSGEGAVLESKPDPLATLVPVGESSSNKLPNSNDETLQIEIALKQQLEQKKQEAIQRQLEVEKQRLEELKKLTMKQEEQQRELQLQQKRAFEELERQEHLRIESERQKELEEKRRRLADLERREQLRRLEEQRVEEEMRRQQAEEEFRRLEEEERLRVLEAERQAVEDLKRKRLESERRNLLEQERRRLEHEEKLRKEAEERAESERRLELQWKADTENARKRLIWKMWSTKLPRRLLEADGTLKSLRQVLALQQDELVVPLNEIQSRRTKRPLEYSNPDDLRQMLECALKQPTSLLTERLLSELVSRLLQQGYFRSKRKKKTMIFKVAVIVAASSSTKSQGLRELILHWIESRIGGFGTLSVASTSGLEVRVVFVNGNRPSLSPVCDAAIFIIPPPWSSSADTKLFESLRALRGSIDDTIPRVALLLCELFDSATMIKRREIVVEALSGSFDELGIVSNKHLDIASLDLSLEQSVKTLLETLPHMPFDTIERMSVHRFCLLCIEPVILRTFDLEQRDDLLTDSKAALELVMNEIRSIAATTVFESSWPAVEFADENELILDYFDEGVHLPINWMTSCTPHAIDPVFNLCATLLTGSFPDVVGRLVASAPAKIQEECYSLLHSRINRQCLLRALQWWVQVNETEAPTGLVLFMPNSLLQQLTHISYSRLEIYADDDGPQTNSIDGSNDVVQLTELRSRDADISLDESTDTVSTEQPGRTIDTNQSVVLNLTAATTDLVGFLPIQNEKKRRRMETSNTMSFEHTASKRFTNKLKGYLEGKVRDIIIGRKSSLSELIRNAPHLVVPASNK